MTFPVATSSEGSGGRVGEASLHALPPEEGDGRDALLAQFFPVCPLLPQPREAMDYRGLRACRGGPPQNLLQEALAYGHFLWLKGLPARALLALARGLYCAVETCHARHPLPYAAMGWMLRHYDHRSGAFLGNPRLSFQHQALRLRGERREQRMWRAWGVNVIARAMRPDLPADPAINSPEPCADTVAAALRQHGVPGEAGSFFAALK